MPLTRNRRGTAYVFPVIGGFVGGDTVAGMLSRQVASQLGPMLMVDIGSNTGRLSWRMPGRYGLPRRRQGPLLAAISYHVGCGLPGVPLRESRSMVIGNGPPIGLCGSGLIDVAAVLLRHEMVSPEGRLLPPEELPRSLSAALERRVLSDSNGNARFLLAERGTNGTDSPIVLTQRDVRELQLACGAIRAGLKNCGCEIRADRGRAW
jgi:uncharacterized 2Fe-2S/4Fe-4S cluster protein (DUF4445 family)